MPMSDSGNTNILIDISTAILRAHDGELQFRALEDADESAKRLPFGQTANAWRFHRHLPMREIAAHHHGRAKWRC